MSFQAIKKFIAGILGLGIVSFSPVIPLGGEQVSFEGIVNAYQTVGFDTFDGDLGVNQYAVWGDGYFVRKEAKSIAPAVYTEDPAEIEGKSEVAITCDKCRYYAYYQTEIGIVRDQIDGSNYPVAPTFSGRVSAVKSFTARGALADVGTTESSVVSGVSSFSFAHNNAGGTNNALIVQASSNDNSNTGRVIETVTYNAVSMTQAVVLDSDDGTTATRSHVGIWYLASPATGSNNVVVTMNSTVTGAVGTAISFTGVDSAVIGATSTAFTTNTSTHQQNITTTQANSVLIDGISHRDEDKTGTMVADAGQEEKQVVIIRPGAGTDLLNSISISTTTSVTTYTMGWTSGSGTDDAEHVIAEILEAEEAVIQQINRQNVFWFD